MPHTELKNKYKITDALETNVNDSMVEHLGNAIPNSLVFKRNKNDE